MAGRTKTPLGMEVGLGTGDFVFDGDPAPPRKKAQPPPNFSVHVYCGKTAEWMKMPLGAEVRCRGLVSVPMSRCPVYCSVVPVYVLARRCTCPAALVYEPLPRYCCATFMAPIVCMPVELTYMRAPLI